jgi:hypothetical protein
MSVWDDDLGLREAKGVQRTGGQGELTTLGDTRLLHGVALWALSRKRPDTYSAFGSYTSGHGHQENELARHGELSIVLNDIEEVKKQAEVKKIPPPAKQPPIYTRVLQPLVT